ERRQRERNHKTGGKRSRKPERLPGAAPRSQTRSKRPRSKRRRGRITRHILIAFAADPAA
ncbi:MAG: hypothetical protein MK220_05635, partial [Candidatus Poseidoniia archaeon]|nr:hypothetical protein [Candidatus Poseidoniia archaeon]